MISSASEVAGGAPFSVSRMLMANLIARRKSELSSSSSSSSSSTEFSYGESYEVVTGRLKAKMSPEGRREFEENEKRNREYLEYEQLYGYDREWPEFSHPPSRGFRASNNTVGKVHSQSSSVVQPAVENTDRLSTGPREYFDLRATASIQPALPRANESISVHKAEEGENKTPSKMDKTSATSCFKVPALPPLPNCLSTGPKEYIDFRATVSIRALPRANESISVHKADGGENKIPSKSSIDQRNRVKPPVPLNQSPVADSNSNALSDKPPQLVAEKKDNETISTPVQSTTKANQSNNMTKSDTYDGYWDFWDQPLVTTKKQVKGSTSVRKAYGGENKTPSKSSIDKASTIPTFNVPALPPPPSSPYDFVKFGPSASQKLPLRASMTDRSKERAGNSSAVGFRGAVNSASSLQEKSRKQWVSDDEDHYWDFFDQPSKQASSSIKKPLDTSVSPAPVLPMQSVLEERRSKRNTERSVSTAPVNPMQHAPELRGSKRQTEKSVLATPASPTKPEPRRSNRKTEKVALSRKAVDPPSTKVSTNQKTDSPAPTEASVKKIAEEEWDRMAGRERSSRLASKRQPSTPTDCVRKMPAKKARTSRKVR